MKLCISMYNQNIWDPVITKDDLDTLFDDTIDGYIGRIYDNNNITSSGMNLDKIDFDPEKISKYFHVNFNIDMDPSRSFIELNNNVSTGGISIGDKVSNMLNGGDNDKMKSLYRSFKDDVEVS